MNRHMRWAFALALLPIAACSNSAPPPAPVVAAPVPPPLAAVDQTFVTAAAASDAAEIQAAQLAQTKAHSPRIKAFAAKMITDHTATTQKLTAIAQSKNVTVTPTLTDAQQQEITKLQAARPRVFDHDYVHGQVADHMAAVKVFQAEIDNGQDADLKAFAQATLPMINQHLTLAQRLAR
jgi:putative membrane protein